MFRLRTGLPGFLVAALLATASSGASARPVVVLGDSIGVGISMASGAPRLATESVAIRSSQIIEQIRRAPRGSVAVISLGTNDAVGSIKGVEGGIDRVVDAVDRAGIEAVWVGPPCVLKPWNTTATRLDAILKSRLQSKDVKYVSVADPALCERALHAGDGVHFTMKGYSMLWERAREAIGGAVDLKPVAMASADGPKKKKRKRSAAKKLQQAHLRDADAAALPAPAR